VSTSGVPGGDDAAGLAREARRDAVDELADDFGGRLVGHLAVGRLGRAGGCIAISISIYLSTNMYTYIYTYICARVCVCVGVCVRVCVRVCLYPGPKMRTRVL
jgi:hypothetical protein